jgi:hypothetical protein
MKTTLLVSLIMAGSALAFAQETDSPKNPPPAEPPRPALPPPPPPPSPGGPRPGDPGARTEQRPERQQPPEIPPRELRRDELGRPGHEYSRSGREGRREGGPGDMRPMVPPNPPKPTPFLGVMTSPVQPALGAQLGLADGFGLLVDEVVADSPAAKAGLQRHDVLKLLNDQQLVDPNQLAALVRAAGKNAEVTLTFVRGGKEQKVSAQIGERMMPERRPLLPNMDDIRRNLHDWEGPIRENLRPLQEGMRQFNERMREFQNRLREWQKNPAAGPAPTPPQLEGAPDAAFGPKPIDILRETRPGGAQEIKVFTDGKSTTWKTAQARVFVKDENGEIELSAVDGKRTLVAKYKDGKVEFSGPIDTEEQRRALPEYLQKRLEQIDAQTRLRPEGSGASSSGSSSAAPLRLEREEPRDIQ